MIMTDTLHDMLWSLTKWSWVHHRYRQIFLNRKPSVSICLDFPLMMSLVLNCPQSSHETQA